MTAVPVTALPPGDVAPAAVGRSARPWLSLSVAAALVAAAGNVVGLAAVDRVYGRETPAFVNQAVAQDVVSLVVVCPLIIVLARSARRGSLAAYLAWLGVLAFTVYNYVIYTLSVHVGVLFLVWVAVLGLALYALAGGLATLDLHRVRACFVSAPRRTVGWFLVVVAVLFAGLWLADIVPAVVAGEVPQGAAELGLPSSPVHVLDLAVYLPATFAAGVLLLRDRAWAYATAPGLLVFLALTCAPILLTPFVAAARGEAPGWAVLPPIAVITVATIALAARLLRTVGRVPAFPGPSSLAADAAGRES